MYTPSRNQNHLLIFLFTLLFFIKLTVVRHVPLINDEAYTLTISRYFSLSYFDHPPLMMWISYFIHSFDTKDLYLFRVPFLACGLLTSFFVYKIGSIIYSSQVGIISAIFYFISPFFFFSGGLFIVPDALLNFSVAGATYIAAKIIFENQNKRYLWFYLGTFLFLAFLSKYQSYLFGFALFVSFITWKRDVFLNYNFYIAVLIAISGLIPVILWNIDNDFASFSFHQNRSSFNFNLLHIFNSLSAQIFLILPTTGLLILMSFTNYIKSPSRKESFLILLALPTILIFNLLIMTSENSFAHWSMMGWMLLLPLSSNYLISMKSFKLTFLALKAVNVVFVHVLIITILVHAKTGFLTQVYGQKLPKWDNTRELLDWQKIAKILEGSLSQYELNSLATLDWYDSGQLASAFNFKYSVNVIGSNSHHFQFIEKKSQDFATLIEFRLLNRSIEKNLENHIAMYGFKINKIVNLPYFRGSTEYGSINVLYLERVD